MSRTLATENHMDTKFPVFRSSRTQAFTGDGVWSLGIQSTLSEKPLELDTYLQHIPVRQLLTNRSLLNMICADLASSFFTYQGETTRRLVRKRHFFTRNLSTDKQKLTGGVISYQPGFRTQRKGVVEDSRLATSTKRNLVQPRSHRLIYIYIATAQRTW